MLVGVKVMIVIGFVGWMLMSVIFSLWSMRVTAPVMLVRVVSSGCVGRVKNKMSMPVMVVLIAMSVIVFSCIKKISPRTVFMC